MNEIGKLFFGIGMVFTLVAPYFLVVYKKLADDEMSKEIWRPYLLLGTILLIIGILMQVTGVMLIVRIWRFL